MNSENILIYAKMMGAGFELNMEMQEMPPDGSKCFECGEMITGKMFQYFLFEGKDLEPQPTKFKYCETCYLKDGG